MKKEDIRLFDELITEHVDSVLHSRKQEVTGVRVGAAQTETEGLLPLSLLSIETNCLNQILEFIADRAFKMSATVRELDQLDLAAQFQLQLDNAATRMAEESVWKDSTPENLKPLMQRMYRNRFLKLKQSRFELRRKKRFAWARPFERLAPFVVGAAAPELFRWLFGNS